MSDLILYDHECTCSYGRIARHGLTVVFAGIGFLSTLGVLALAVWGL